MTIDSVEVAPSVSSSLSASEPDSRRLLGDWEDALAAASHTGARAIAEYLIGKGARPTVFSAAMLGQLDVVKACVAAFPGIQRSVGPHSIRLLAHARAGGPAARAVVDYLDALGDADSQPGLVGLTADDETRLSGVYVFGNGPADRLEIASTPRSPTAPPRIAGGELGIRRPGRTIRQLFHVGDHAFYPSGAEAVRIRIANRDGRPSILTVHDPGIVLTARRSPS